MKIILDQMRSLLDSAYLFNLLERVAGVGAVRKRIIKDFVAPFDEASILDIGCGTGAILDHLPNNINYVGFDISYKYINYAEKKYKNRGKFYCKSITDDINLLPESSFDFVISFGVIHHLSDDEALILIKKAKNYLKNGGVFITIDPVYVDNQSAFSRLLIDNDRGEYVRDTEGHMSLFLDIFDKTKGVVINDMLVYNYDYYITRSKK
jgi:SAM-dependent methyltransferase